MNKYITRFYNDNKENNVQKSNINSQKTFENNKESIKTIEKLPHQIYPYLYIYIIVAKLLFVSIQT